MEWKAEYYFVFFCVFVGAGYQFTQATPRPGDTVIKRVYSAFAATLFIGLLEIGVCLIWLNLQLWIPAFLGIPLGAIGETALRVWWEYGNEAKGFKDFVRRMQWTWNQYNKLNDDEK